MADENMYGWTFDNFNAFVGWDIGDQLKYEAWENHWSRRIDAYIFIAIGLSPRLTDANEKLEVGDIVNELLVQTNIYLKAESVSDPMETGFYTGPGFPVFHGDPEADDGKGSGHYRTLNKLRRKYSVLKVSSIRIGPVPNENPFYQDKLYR
jgi:hypothetical protein